MWTFSLLKALALWVRLAPFLVLRLAVFAGVALVLALAAWLGSWGAASAGLVAVSWGALAGALAGGAVVAVVLWVWRGAALWSLLAMQVALLSDLLDRKRVPFGPGQIAHARTGVAARFGSATDLKVLGRFVRGVTGAIAPVAEWGGGLLALPVLGRVALGGLVDQAVLAHAYRARPENAWEAAHDGLVLATQNARELLGTAARLTAAGWLATLALGLVMLQPLSGLTAFWPGEDPAVALVLAALVALALRAALVQPFLAACVLQSFRGLVSGQAPLGEWRGRLTQVSAPFRTLGERALAWQPDSGHAA